MFGRRGIQPRRANERGATLLIVAVAMVGLLAVCAFAIDLANFYLARAEAQRAADAAALAGATIFVSTSCTSAGNCSSFEGSARQQAEWIGDQNYIAGKAASIQGGDVTFSYPNPQEPQITVIARSSVPTFFAKIFGISTANVSATATAEAYNPSGGDAPVGAACLRPFLVPDCDPTPTHSSPINPNCPTGYGNQGYFFDTSTSPPTIEHPGNYPNGVIGMPWQLHTAAAPSQWYLVGFKGSPPSSGSALRQHIEECTPAPLACGDQLTTANGKNVGPTDQGTNALINASGDGFNRGQDSIDTSVGPPFAILGGPNNPNPALVGKTFYDYSESPSVVTVPVYNGVSLNPGGSTVQIDGYMQVFIEDAVHNGNDDYIDIIILNISSCGGSSGGGGGNPIVAAGGSSIPIRLIRTN
jgi:Putative Flp pilus-assembly TadE/G-like